MEKLKKTRSIVRGLFTKHHNALLQLIKEQKLIEARSAFLIFAEYAEDLGQKNEEILNLMLDEDVSDEDLGKEAATADAYKCKFFDVKVRMDELESENAKNYYGCTMSKTSTKAANQRLKLPKIEFRKFGGDLREWLPFWNQFERIDLDDSVDPADKFQLLIQATVENSRARKVVESFPATGKNYPLAIHALKERFAREDLIIEVYIRDLIGMTLPGRRFSKIMDMYDKVECMLKALEELGVTKGKCAAVLCPLLESCMTEDFLRLWLRHSSGVSDSETRLEKFLSFLKSEVQNEERFEVSKEGFGFSDEECSTKKVQKNELRPKTVQNVPSATGLLSVEKYDRMPCIFCGHSLHSNADCYKARDLTLQNRIDIITRKNCCTICAKYHDSLCNYNQKCVICDDRHVVLLCPHLNRTRSDASVSDSIRPSSNENLFANLSSDTNVLLPTLMVNIRGNGFHRRVRAVIDTGSQRSYVLKKTARDMAYPPIGEETVVHSLFGGHKTGHCSHKRYRIYVSNCEETYHCNFEVLDQDSICDDLPGVQEGVWCEEAKQLGIQTDQFLSNSGPIELLIGADIAVKLFTGIIKALPCGLTAMQTLLGWSLVGKMSKLQPKMTNAMLVTSMLAEDLSFSSQSKIKFDCKLLENKNKVDVMVGGLMLVKPGDSKKLDGPIHGSAKSTTLIEETNSRDFITSRRRRKRRSTQTMRTVSLLNGS